METIADRLAITIDNIDDTKDAIEAVDQQNAIRVDMVISHHVITDRNRQKGGITIYHNEGRAAISHHGAFSDWGDYDETTGRITMEDGDIYNLDGELVRKGGIR